LRLGGASSFASCSRSARSNVLWGGTFLAIRIAVLQIPPFFTAGVRFFTAGILLHAFMRLRGEARLSFIEWRNTAIIGLCMFVLTYGPLFWAENTCRPASRR